MGVGESGRSSRSLCYDGSGEKGQVRARLRVRGMVHGAIPVACDDDAYGVVEWENRSCAIV